MVVTSASLGTIIVVVIVVCVAAAAAITVTFSARLHCLVSHQLYLRPPPCSPQIRVVFTYCLLLPCLLVHFSILRYSLFEIPIIVIRKQKKTQIYII